MASLSSLIVQRQVATIVEVEQAIARQVIHGGDLVTNLLEVAPHCEHALTRVLSESLGFPSMPPGRLPAPSSEVLDLVPVELALRSGIFPLRVAGRSLVVATSERLAPSVEHDLAYALKLDITPVGAPLIRIREGIAAHYGIPLEPRQLRLVQRLDGIDVTRAPSRPPPPAPVADLPPSNLRSGVSSPPAPRSSTPVMKHSGLLPAVRPITEERETDPGAPPEVEVPPAPPAPVIPEASAEASPPTEGGPGVEAPQEEVATHATSMPPRSSPAASSEPPPPPPRSDAPPADDSPRPGTVVDRRAALRLVQREIADKKKSARTARRKGPFSRVDAEREIENAKSPEDILDAFFGFGSQFFEYCALFVVHGDVAEGRDAWGPGADLVRVIGLGVPLDLPGSLARVRQEGRVILSRFDEDDLDRELRKDLGRARPKSGLAAVIPLTVRSRSVAMLVGDDGEADVTLANLGDLVGFSALASAQLERLALMKKGKRPPFAGLVAPRAHTANVEALARALGDPAAGAAVTPMPAPRAATFAVPAEPPLPSPLPPPRPTTEPPLAPPPQPAPPAGPSEPVDEIPPTAPAALLSDPASLLIPAAPPAPLESPPSIQIRTDTPTTGTPSSLEPRVSPGAASVHPPPANPDTTKPYDDQVLVRPSADVPAPDTRRDEPRRDDTVLGLGEIESGPPPRVIIHEPDEEDDDRRFVRPIPREDDEDASALLAEQAGEWGRPGQTRAREERFGTYHIVPRPADARVRGDERADIDKLLERSLMGGLEGEEAMSELFTIAEHTFAKLVDRFPGPLSVDRFKARENIPPASECGPLLKILVTSRRHTLPFMTVRSASPEVEQRFWATHVLGELLFPESSNAVLPRLFDDDVSVRRVARRAAQALVSAGAPGEPIKRSLENTLKNVDEPMHRRILAIEALADIRVPAVVPVLISALADPSDAIVEGGRTALIVVTRQDLGRIADVWRHWWDAHQHEHRIEWLIHALTHESSSIRRAAGDELKLITREYFGYYDDLPPRERERAQERYLAWWRDEGRYKFR